MPSPAHFGAIEAGGSKFVCAVGTPDGKLLHRIRIPTTTPAETLPQVAAFFRSHGEDLTAIGIGSFGPIEMDRSSPRYGFITSTPKPGWSQCDLLGIVRKALGVPVAFDTDVNAAARAEARWGTARGLRSFMYVTVGTGIGAAAMIDKSILQGLSHPEMGHIRIPHDLTRDPFAGICPYHGDCLEGLASGPAIAARWKTSPAALPPEHSAWTLEAEYLALACVNWISTLVPERVIFGGGVMRPNIFPIMRSRVRTLLNSYIDLPELTGDLGSYLVPSTLEPDAGVLGALVLALQVAGLS
jgi:fructokinase